MNLSMEVIKEIVCIIQCLTLLTLTSKPVFSLEPVKIKIITLSDYFLIF